jgi:hypothetical protein
MLAVAPAARGNHHEIKISEVFHGSGANIDAEFVELQMYSPGQNVFVGNTPRIRFYIETGSTGFAEFTTNPTGGSQRTILAATTQAVTDLALPTPDLTYADGNYLANTGGAVCFESVPFGNIDCAAYGDYNNAINNLPGIGTPETAPALGSSIARSIAPGCPTLLEASDDTGDSATDFVLLDTPTPRPSSTTPTEMACGGGGGGTGTGTGTGTGDQSDGKKKCPKGKKLKKGKCVKKKGKKKR